MTLFDSPAEPTGPSGPVVRVRATVAYEGSGFSGFAVQPGRRTVAGVLQEALSKVLRMPVEVTCAGRTDAGVHAWGQVVSFDVPEERFDAEKLRNALNSLCAPAIAVRSVEAAAPDFDARFSATSRRYRYTILNTPIPSPFLATQAWWVAQPLDVRRLEAACDPLFGEHDFSSFCRRPKVAEGEPEKSLVRRVVDARWVDEGDGLLRFWIEANAFCHNMVRSIVGTLVDAGLGKRTPADMTATLRARDRATAGPVAPPHGLVLWEVRYD